MKRACYKNIATLYSRSNVSQWNARQHSTTAQNTGKPNMGISNDTDHFGSYPHSNMPVTVVPNTSANNPATLERLRFIGQILLSRILSLDS